jgi:hypothetical protein
MGTRDDGSGANVNSGIILCGKAKAGIAEYETAVNLALAGIFTARREGLVFNAK